MIHSWNNVINMIFLGEGSAVPGQNPAARANAIYSIPGARRSGAGRLTIRFSLPAARKEVRFREALKLIKFSLIWAELSFPPPPLHHHGEVLVMLARRVPQQKLVSNIFLGGKWCFGTIEINLECKRTTGGGTWSDPGKYVLSGLWCCTVFVNAKKVQQRDGPREIITRIES